MPSIKVNTDAAVNAAGNIARINKSINDRFDSVWRAVKNLDGSWDGPASSNAIARFNTIRDACCNNRYKVLENYSRLLLNAVGKGYEETESSNISLADQFK